MDKLSLVENIRYIYREEFTRRSLTSAAGGQRMGVWGRAGEKGWLAPAPAPPVRYIRNATRSMRGDRLQACVSPTTFKHNYSPTHSLRCNSSKTPTNIFFTYAPPEPLCKCCRKRTCFKLEKNSNGSEAETSFHWGTWGTCTPQTVWRLWLIVYRTELTVSLLCVTLNAKTGKIVLVTPCIQI